MPTYAACCQLGVELVRYRVCASQLSCPEQHRGPWGLDPRPRLCPSCAVALGGLFICVRAGYSSHPQKEKMTNLQGWRVWPPLPQNVFNKHLFPFNPCSIPGHRDNGGTLEVGPQRSR